MNLVNELTKKEVLKFQINGLNKGFDQKFIKETLSMNNEGIFNLDSNIDTYEAEVLAKSLIRNNNNNYTFELNYSITNYEIMFKKKELTN